MMQYFCLVVLFFGISAVISHMILAVNPFFSCLHSNISQRHTAQKLGEISFD